MAEAAGIRVPDSDLWRLNYEGLAGLKEKVARGEDLQPWAQHMVARYRQESGEPGEQVLTRMQANAAARMVAAQKEERGESPVIGPSDPAFGSQPLPAPQVQFIYPTVAAIYRAGTAEEQAQMRTTIHDDLAGKGVRGQVLVLEDRSGTLADAHLFDLNVKAPEREPSIVERYTSQLREFGSAIQHQITQTFREFGETWRNTFDYEKSRWRWATEEQRMVPGSSISGLVTEAVPKRPEIALETSQAVQGAIRETGAAREAREAWLLDPNGTTRQQLIHRHAAEVQERGVAVSPLSPRERAAQILAAERNRPETQPALAAIQQVRSHTAIDRAPVVRERGQGQER